MRFVLWLCILFTCVRDIVVGVPSQFEQINSIVLVSVTISMFYWYNRDI